jgi:hypothetical protein
MTNSFNRVVVGIQGPLSRAQSNFRRGFSDLVDLGEGAISSAEDALRSSYWYAYRAMNEHAPDFTEAEKDFIRKHPVAATNFVSNAAIAVMWAATNFSDESAHNGSGDAFRHCFWSALNASAHGFVLAKMFGDAHEDTPWNPKDEMAMDKHNNDVGFKIGAALRFGGLWAIATQCFAAWQDGQLVQIDPKRANDLKYSSDLGRLFYGVEKK